MQSAFCTCHWTNVARHDQKPAWMDQSDTTIHFPRSPVPSNPANDEMLSCLLPWIPSQLGRACYPYDIQLLCEGIFNLPQSSLKLLVLEDFISAVCPAAKWVENWRWCLCWETYISPTWIFSDVLLIVCQSGHFPKTTTITVKDDFWKAFRLRKAKSSPKCINMLGNLVTRTTLFHLDMLDSCALLTSLLPAVAVKRHNRELGKSNQ